MKHTKLLIFGDGGSRGNPGPAASGFVITHQGKVLEQGGKFLGHTTNNQAEYQAVVLALQAAKKFEPGEIEFHLDSLLVVSQLNGVYKMKNQDLKVHFDAIKQLVAEFPKVTFTHVRREYNKLADAEVNRILDEQT